MSHAPSEAPELRPATDDDIPAMVGLIRAAFAEYEGRLDPPSSAQNKTVEATRAELADGGAFVVTCGGELAGCVFYHPHAGHMYLDRLSVLPAYRGLRLSRRLIAAVEDLARASGLDRVRLSVRLALAGNRAYYERLGYAFHAYGTHAGYPEPTYVTLEKAL
ncbi:MAG TPA: GNAT family N-acetyltransferase [Herpetosiphonaceae bacterium]|nr:GNAT family N-acetyltransferase [Herpetosiphonaceae bacterium]